MGAYIIRRLLLFIPTLAAVWVILFVVIRVAGDPAAAKLGQRATPEEIRTWKKTYGLDKPRIFEARALALAISGLIQPEGLDARVQKRYARDIQAGQDDLSWYDVKRPVGSLTVRAFDTQLVNSLWDKLMFNFGRSAAYNQPVSGIIRDGLVPSLSITLPMLVVGLVISVYLSMFCALYRARLVDHSITFVCVVLMSLSVPAVILLVQHGVEKIGWFPVSGYVFGWRSVGFVALPILIGMLLGLGHNTRFYRSVLIEEIRKDYVRTARAKGLQEGVVLFKHVLKNAMIPIVTRVVIAIPFLYTGAFLLETFFGIPGLGRMTYEALNNADFAVLEAVTFIGALLFMGANLVCDILYVLLDPRVRLR